MKKYNLLLGACILSYLAFNPTAEAKRTLGFHPVGLASSQYSLAPNPCTHHTIVRAMLRNQSPLIQHVKATLTDRNIQVGACNPLPGFLLTGWNQDPLSTSCYNVAKSLPETSSTIILGPNKGATLDLSYMCRLSTDGGLYSCGPFTSIPPVVNNVPPVWLQSTFTLTLEVAEDRGAVIASLFTFVNSLCAETPSVPFNFSINGGTAF